MRAIVIGAGLVGVTTAWELRRAGHQVTVLERRSGVAAETSYANAGLVAPGHAVPWGSPKVPGLLFKSLLVKNQAYRLKPRLDRHMLGWGLRFLRECTPARTAANTVHEYRLCRYAQSRLHGVSEEASLHYDARRDGLLYLYRSQAGLRQGLEHMKVMQDLGHEARALSVDEIIELDPAYAPARDKIAGAAYCPTDESGDARLFTQQLAEACREKGVEFIFNCAVEHIKTRASRIEGMVTSAGEQTSDSYVLACGAEAPRLTRPIGLNLPIYPVKGYSVTFPLAAEHLAPSIGGLDEDRVIAFSRLGDRLRVTSVAEIAGYDVSHRPADFAPMIREFSTLLPDAADYASPQYWSCLRPMTPNSLPILGPSPYRNLYLNVGHGNMGWTMACGTARLVADLIDGREPELPMAAMSLH